MIKKYSEFILEKSNINLTLGIKDLLSTFSEDIDIFREFKINKDDINPKDEIEKLYTNSQFKNYIKDNKLKIGKSQNTKHSETLLNDRYILKFFFIYGINSNEIEEPKYIIMQFFDNKKNKRSDIFGYLNHNETNIFHKKLTDNTIELTNGNDTYIYQTSNGGNNWEMKNVQMEDDNIKGELDKDSLNKMISRYNLKLK